MARHSAVVRRSRTPPDYPGSIVHFRPGILARSANPQTDGLAFADRKENPRSASAVINDGCHAKAQRGQTSEIQHLSLKGEFSMADEFVEHDPETPTEADVEKAYSSQFLGVVDVG